MAKDILADLCGGLEDEFFHRVDQELRKRMRSNEARQSLADASGITDETVLNELLAVGITPDTLVAVSLVPLIQVAWADRKLEQGERDAVLAAAESQQIGKDSVAYELLQQWLDHAPSDKLFTAWHDYFAALADALSPDVLKSLKQDLWSRSCAVAEAAGGVLGMGTISAVEKTVLKKLKETLGDE